jgi:hypothetical protein
MMVDVYIIRKGMDEFFVYNQDEDNWIWGNNIDDATIFSTPEKAETIRVQKKTGTDSYVFKTPYFVPNVQQRKKKLSKKPKRKVKSKIIKKGKSKKRK